MSDEIEYEVMDVQDVRFLKERIRELEITRQVEADYFHNELKEVRTRIAKAREILIETLQRTSWRGYDTAQTDTRRALAALEGK